MWIFFAENIDITETLLCTGRLPSTVYRKVTVYCVPEGYRLLSTVYRKVTVSFLPLILTRYFHPFKIKGRHFRTVLKCTTNKTIILIGQTSAKRYTLSILDRKFSLKPQHLTCSTYMVDMSLWISWFWFHDAHKVVFHCKTTLNFLLL